MYVFFVCRETAANEKHPHNRPNTIAASKHTSIFTEGADLFCPSSPASPKLSEGGSPDGQKEKCLCALGVSVVKLG